MTRPSVAGVLRREPVCRPSMRDRHGQTGVPAHARCEELSVTQTSRTTAIPARGAACWLAFEENKTQLVLIRKQGWQSWLACRRGGAAAGQRVPAPTHAPPHAPAHATDHVWACPGAAPCFRYGRAASRVSAAARAGPAQLRHCYTSACPCWPRAAPRARMSAAPQPPHEPPPGISRRRPVLARAGLASPPDPAKCLPWPATGRARGRQSGLRSADGSW